jgi:putative multiple sugar transport system permease protein
MTTSTPTPVRRKLPRLSINLRQYGILAALVVIVVLFEILTR